MNSSVFNKILNDEEIGQHKVKLKSFTRSLVVTLCSQCNVDCIMCEVKNTKWEIPQKTIEEIIEFFPYLENLIWQGGEIFLLNYFENIFNEAAKFKEMRQTIVTNGLLITEKWARKLVENNIELAFSVDGVTKDIYEHIRRGAKFDDVIKGINIINDARKKFDSGYMSLRLHVVIMKSNYLQLEGFVDFAKEYGFDTIHLMPMWGNPNNAENIFSQKDAQALEYINSANNIIEEKARRYNIKLLNSLPINHRCLSDRNNQEDNKNYPQIEENKLFCLLPWHQLNIDPGGGVRPGCLCVKPVGNILEDNLKDLWNNQLMQLYRKKIINEDCYQWCNTACLSGQITNELKRT